jgi:hypothetical protein
MKFQVDVPDDVFWMVSKRAAAVDMTAPRFVAVVAARLAAMEPQPGDPLEVLENELRAARASGWRATHSRLSRKKKPRLDFTDREMEIAIGAMNRKRTK